MQSTKLLGFPLQSAICDPRFSPGIGRRPTGRSKPKGRRGTLRAGLAAGFVLGLAGCLPREGESHRLVVATPWPPSVRLACEAVYRQEGGSRPIAWVGLGSHRWLDACDRRGGVDLVLGGPARLFQRLADAGRLVAISPTDPVAWRVVERPQGLASPSGPNPSIDRGQDPRDDPATFAEAKSVLEAEGWSKGYETLVRRPVELMPKAATPRPASKVPLEAVAVSKTGRHPDQARRFLTALTSQGWIAPAPPDADLDARTDDLLADLLGAALVDARNERRDALIALEVHDHPKPAESAIGEAPPWPPASAAKLRADPTRAGLLDSLSAQIAPDPESLDWLRASWQRPKRAVDLPFLREIGRASGGRLAREPRFRAWLRGEWTAWTQQLYRRVARLAGGYRPS